MQIEKEILEEGKINKYIILNKEQVKNFKMNTQLSMLDTINNSELTVSNSEKWWTFPWWWVRSLIAAKKLLEISNPDWSDEQIDLIIEKNDWEIQKAWNPRELAEALDEYIEWYVVAPMSNIHEWIVDDTIIAVMKHFEDTWKVLRMIWNIEVEIKHCLVWKPWQKVEDIKNGAIYSHLKAIEQCHKKIDDMWIDTINVSGTSVELERSKNEDGVFLLIDKDTATKEWLEIYDDMMWPENNFTTFAIMTSDPDLRLNKEVIWNKDFSVWLIKVAKKKWWLLSSLLPLVIMEDQMDMKKIVSSLNWDKPMIWFVSSWKTVNDYHEKYNKIVNGDEKITRKLILALYSILKNNEYKIDYKEIWPDNYILTANNKPWALIKMLILFEQHNINLDSINSEIEWDKVKIYIQTTDSLDWFKTKNMPGWARNYFAKFIEENQNDISRIMCL